MVETVALELETHHPVIEPVSAPGGTEIFDAETNPKMGPFCQAETARRDTCGFEKPPFWRDKR